MSELYTAKPTNISPEEVVKLNEFFTVSFRDIEKYLNAGVVETTRSEGYWLVPRIDVVPGVATIPDSDEGAFSLNAPGKITVEFEKVKPHTVLLRNAFSYEAARFAAKSLKSFQTIFGPPVNDMIDELRAIKGFTEGQTSYGKYYGTFSRPGSGEVFRDLDESQGGIEIRLYSDTSLLPLNNNKS